MHAHNLRVDRRTALKYGGLALAGASALPGVATADSDGPVALDPTTAASFTSANHSRAETDGKDDTYLTEATATADEPTNTAEALAKVDYHDGLFGRKAVAATGVHLTVEASETATVDIAVSGEYAAKVSASGSAGAGAIVSVKIIDLTAGETVADQTVDEAQVGTGEDQPTASDSTSGAVDTTATVDLEPGHEYAIELVADSRLSMMGGTSAEADQDAGGLFDYDGGATWDQIEITPA